MIELIYTEQKITELEIIDFEKRFSLSFPTKLKKLLLKYNGGEPKEDILIKIGDEENHIKDFYSLKYEINNVLISFVIDAYQITEKHIPREYIPIASDVSDNPFTVSTKEGEEGQIHIWYMDVGEIEQHFVANDLEEFLGGWIE